MAQSQSQSVASFDRPDNPAQQAFLLQRAAWRRHPVPDYAQRSENLRRLEQLLLDNQAAIIAAIDRDYGGRAAQETQLMELFPAIDGIRYTRKRLKRWMKPQRRHVSLWFAGGRNRVIPQPKGVVGVVVPWNYPLFLLIGPLTSALAAGNRCLVKMAANSKHLCELLARLVSEVFPADTLQILPGVKGGDFTSLPFDHIVFTGSAETGRTVMRSAADNLTPVTLELGGKSPTIIADDFDLRVAAERIVQGKWINAGQTCVAPDYVMVPRAKLEMFTTLVREQVTKRYPAGLGDAALTSVIDDSAYRRLRATLEDAANKGATVTPLLAGTAFDDRAHRMVPHLITAVSDDMTLMKAEIFGPLLPVKPYDTLREALDYIVDRDHPLALYLYTNNADTEQQVLNGTLSGGVCINDCMLHVGQHDLPFGGVGSSGIGHYHAYEGFVELSKLRPVFKQSPLSALKLLYPPYGKVFETLYTLMLKLKL